MGIDPSRFEGSNPDLGGSLFVGNYEEPDDHGAHAVSASDG